MADESKVTTRKDDDEHEKQGKKSSLFTQAFKKLSKQRALGTAAASAFFARKVATPPTSNSSSPAAASSASKPGFIKEKTGQLPPVWQQAPPPAPSNASEDITNRTRRSGSITSTTPWIEEIPLPGEKDEPGSSRKHRFHKLLDAPAIDLEALRELSWSGVPEIYRAMVWQLLLGYLPSKKDRRNPMLRRKRQEYADCVSQYYNISDSERSATEQKTLRQILVDIPRTNPEPLFQDPVTCQIMERVLYIWAIRHPASGYVQGLNDLLTPFFIVFLSPYVEKFNTPTCESLLSLDLSSRSTDNDNRISQVVLDAVEADTYWCLVKILDGIQDHYTASQPGLQRMVFKMEELVHRCDESLHQHLVEVEGVQFLQFAFRWMNCLLMREVPLSAVVRLWDTYLSEEGGFERFHVYVCAALLMTFGDDLKTMAFQDLILFLQDLPTSEWSENDVEPLLSRAFILKSYFEDAPHHLSQ